MVLRGWMMTPEDRAAEVMRRTLGRQSIDRQELGESVADAIRHAVTEERERCEELMALSAVALSPTWSRFNEDDMRAARRFVREFLDAEAVRDAVAEEREHCARIAEDCARRNESCPANCKCGNGYHVAAAIRRQTPQEGASEGERQAGSALDQQEG